MLASFALHLFAVGDPNQRISVHCRGHRRRRSAGDQPERRQLEVLHEAVHCMGCDHLPNGSNVCSSFCTGVGLM